MRPIKVAGAYAAEALLNFFFFDCVEVTNAHREAFIHL